ncbi:cupin domain-containing protein, partial [Klebsiella pneumoniae]
GTAGPNMIELWRWDMQPGEAFTSPGHPATTFELLHVEAGALTLTLGETCRTVAAGESAVARTEIEHGYRNEGTAPLVFTMTVAELPS